MLQKSLEKCIFAPGIATLPCKRSWILPKPTRRAAGHGGSFSCCLRNVAPPCGITRAFEVMPDSIGKYIGLSLAVFLRVLLGG